ncbi:MAG: hypothetical protein ACR2M3_19555 [Thermomicrobiales bacterium]
MATEQQQTEKDALVLQWMRTVGGALWLVELADAGYGDPITRSLVKRGLIVRERDPWGKIIFSLTETGWSSNG